MANIFSPDIEGKSGFASASFPDAIHAELAEAFPDVELTAEQLDAEYHRELARCEAAAKAAGIEHGFTVRTPKYRFGITVGSMTYEGFTVLPDGKRVKTGIRADTAWDAEEAAILLAGRLASELTPAPAIQLATAAAERVA